MRIYIWSVGSARTRPDRVVEMLRRNDIDVPAVQETKCRDDQFPTATFEKLGCQVAHHGLNRWNGVAIISRVDLKDIQAGFPGQPDFNKDPGATPSLEARRIAATCGGVRAHNLCIPNGRDIANLHFEYRLEFLERLRQHIIATLDDDPEATFMMDGDFDIAPIDGGVWSVTAFTGKVHVTLPGHTAFYVPEQVGTKEVTHQFTPNQWTYWDYEAGRFFKDKGTRIDFQLASLALVTKASAGFIGIEERQGRDASDHAPMIVDYEI